MLLLRKNSLPGFWVLIENDHRAPKWPYDLIYPKELGVLTHQAIKWNVLAASPSLSGSDTVPDISSCYPLGHMR